MQELSTRLAAVANFVSEGGRVCDIGCDHAYLPIALVQTGRIHSAIAMDVRPGPLAIAGDNIAAANLEKEITTRCSNGLSALHPYEADSIVLAGMGGMLMKEILEAGYETALSAKEWILQPQSDITGLRQWIRQSDFGIIDEELITDRGKLYVVIKAVRKTGNTAEREEDAPVFRNLMKICDCSCGAEDTGTKQTIHAICDRFGPVLLTVRHPLLYTFLQKEDARLSHLCDQLSVQDSLEAKERCAVLTGERSLTRKALQLWQI